MYYNSMRYFWNSTIRFIEYIVGTIGNILITSRIREVFLRSFFWIYNPNIIIKKSGSLFNIEWFIYK